MAATIKDIAQRLNVSVSTVSYALNGGPRQVPESTRRRVLDVAAELQYRPNRLARSLQGRRSHVLGSCRRSSRPTWRSGRTSSRGSTGSSRRPRRPGTT